VFPLRCHPFNFLGATSEIIIQMRGLANQIVLISWKSLNNYGVFDIRAQIFIKLYHFNTLVLINSKGVLNKSG
jgi:hypothetical protein